MSETPKIGYQFVPVPLKLFLCCDNNCRSVLTSLIQLGSIFADEDGWFFCSNADLQAETNLSKNVLSAALDALYQKKIVYIKPERKGRGEKQKSRLYKLNKEAFDIYDKYSIENCMKHPLYEIKTVPYHSNFVPSFQKMQKNLQENMQMNMQKSDNHIDNIENTENIEIKITGLKVYNGFDSSFSFSSPLQGASNFNGQEVSTGVEIKPVNGQQDAKHINSQPVRDKGSELVKNENNIVISTPEQEQAKQDYIKNLYKVASQAFGDVQANYVTVLSTPEDYCDMACNILNKSGDYLFNQYQSLNGEQGEQAFGKIINALARYRLHVPEDKKAVEDVFKYLLRRKYDERKCYQEQGLDYDEVYG